MGCISRSDILKRVITLQSKKHKGFYLSCQQDSDIISVKECYYTDVPNAEWTRFIVHEGPDDTIILESLLRRNHYLDVNQLSQIHIENTNGLTKSPYPPTDSHWAQWRLENANEEDVIALESNLYRGTYLSAEDPFKDILSLRIKRDINLIPFAVKKTDAGDYSEQWILGIGPGQGIIDGYEVVASVGNSLDKPVKYDYTYTTGSSVSEGSSAKLTDSLSYEMSANFKAGPLTIGAKTTLSFSKEWSTTESRTWQEATTISTSVEVPAKKKVVISQLQGTYGPLSIKTNNILISSEELNK